uniref:PH domain-containing protein n=1 Tax=Plectus sambesii TaxID=2011161 RepID=A0A914WLB7_9BILA
MAVVREILQRDDLIPQVFLKEGYLLKQGRSFQRWRRRYFRLKGRKLYYAQDHLALIFNEIDLIDFSVAERHSKSAHAFQ